MTATTNRSYQLSDIFRQRGSKVVLGGIHPTILPQEAIQHADAVVIERQKAVGQMSSPILERESSRNSTMYQNLIFQRSLSATRIFILTKHI